MRFIIDLNSFEVEANSREEAIEKAEEMLKSDVTLAYPFSVVEIVEYEDNRDMTRHLNPL